MTPCSPWVVSGRLSAFTKSLEYGCWGPSPAEAPTIVLLHEGLGSVALWRTFPEDLANATGFGVVAYSRAGYGQSDPADLPRSLNYMTLEATEVLPEVLNAIGIEQGMLVGHSDGATIAAIHAGCMNDPRLRGIVTMAPHFFTEPVGLTEIARAREAYETSDLKGRLARYHRDPDNAFRGWNDSWLHPDFKHWNVADVIDDISVPVLAIQGENDQYGTLAQIDALAVRCNAPVDTLVLADCQHSPFLDQPETVVGAIADFCRRVHNSTRFIGSVE